MNVVIFHHGDMDGFASAAIISAAVSNLMRGSYNHYNVSDENIEYVVCNHSSEIKFDPETLTPDTLVFIVDYSPSNPEHLTLFSRIFDIVEGNVVWIDHHATSTDVMEKNPVMKHIANTTGYVDPTNTAAATVLCYEWYEAASRVFDHDVDIRTNLMNIYFELDEVSIDIPYWIKLVDDYDRWQMNMEESLQFNNGCYYYGLHDVFTNMSSLCDIKPASFRDMLTMSPYPDGCMCDLKCEEIISTGKILTEAKNRDNKRLVNAISFEREFQTEDGKSYKVICLNAVGNSSVFGDKYDEYDAVCLFSYNGTHYEYSMFAKDSSPIDCSAFAKYFGEKYGITGGGHLHAAGWSTPENILEKNIIKMGN